VSLLTSCKQPQSSSSSSSTLNIQGESVNLSVDMGEEEQPVDLLKEGFADSVRYVPLETNDDVLISSIEKIDVADGFIYIHDATKKIMKFDMSGKFVYAIDRVGLGPGEYSSIYDFCVRDGKVEVLDLENRRLLSYRASDGKFIRSIPLKSFFYHFMPIVGHHYLGDIHLYQKKKGMGVILLDSLTNEREKLLWYGMFPTLGENINTFVALRGGSYGIFSQPDNTVYHYTYPDKLERAYTYQFNKGIPIPSLPGKESFQLSQEQIEDLLTPCFYMEGKSFIWLSVIYGSRGYQVFYDKRTKKVSTSPAVFCSGMQCFHPLPTDTPHLVVCAVVSSILEAMKKAPKDKIPPEMQENALYKMALQSKEESNPIVQLIYLK
jgi:hypothetical protein